MGINVIMIETVGICNATCKYCPQGAGMLARPNINEIYLAPRILEKALFLAKNGNQKAIYLHHRGEPLLHPEIAHIIRKVRKAGFLAYLSTNLIAATPDKIEEVLNAGVNEFEIHISASLTKISIDETLKRVHIVRKMNWTLRDNGCKIKTNYALQDNETEETVRTKLARSKYYDEDMPIKFYKPYDWPGIMNKDGSLQITQDNTMKLEDCEWYKTKSCAILANGDLVICCLDQKGYSKKVNIMDIDMINFEHLSNREICKKCVLYKWDMEWLKRDALSIPESIQRRQERSG